MQNKNAKDIGTMKTAETELENVILLILLINFCKLAGTLAIEGKVISIFDNESMQRYSEYIWQRSPKDIVCGVDNMSLNVCALFTKSSKLFKPLAMYVILIIIP